MDQKFGIACPIMLMVNAPNRYTLSRNGWKLNVQRNNLKPYIYITLISDQILFKRGTGTAGAPPLLL